MSIKQLMDIPRNIDFVRVNNAGHLEVVQTRYISVSNCVRSFDKASKDYDFSFAWIDASTVLISVRGIKDQFDNMFNGL